MPPLPSVTKALFLVCAGLFCYFELWPEQRHWLLLWPVASGRWMPWQLVSHAFLHVDLFHLAINMLGLVTIGSQLELEVGRKRYGLVLVAGMLSAAAVALLLGYVTGDPATYQGLSGALFGVLIAYVLLHPNEIVEFIWPPIPIRVKYLAAIFIGLEVILGLMPGAQQAHFAHIGGILGAWLLVRYWRGFRRF